MSRRETDDTAFNFLSEIFNNALKDFGSITLNESELKSLIYGSKMNLHQITESRKCSVKYCRNNAVMSHLFQESILRKISKNGHLLYPSYDLKNRKIKLQRIGVNKALIFPGYCQKHEDMFEYEKKEQINYEHELRALIFKTVCYNHVYWEETYKKMERSIKSLISKRHEKFDESYNRKYQPLFETIGTKLKSFHFADARHKSFENFLKERKVLIKEAKEFKKMAWNDIQAKANTNLKSYIVEFDIVLPICLSYLGELNIKKGESNFRETVCFIIHPYKTTTHLIFTIPAIKYNSLVDVFQDLTNEKAWELILSSLVFISDNWLINEDFYNDYYPSSLKELIENAICLPIIPKRTE